MRVIGEGSVGEIVVCIGYLYKKLLQKNIALSFLGTIVFDILVAVIVVIA